MTINEARLIREVKRRCTYRRLAEIYYPETETGFHGMQMEGQDLCKEALKVLYPSHDIWQKGVPQELNEHYKFDAENRSWFGGRIADYYWWE